MVFTFFYIIYISWIILVLNGDSPNVTDIFTNGGDLINNLNHNFAQHGANTNTEITNGNHRNDNFSNRRNYRRYNQNNARYDNSNKNFKHNYRNIK